MKSDRFRKCRKSIYYAMFTDEPYESTYFIRDIPRKIRNKRDCVQCAAKYHIVDYGMEFDMCIHDMGFGSNYIFAFEI